MNPDALRNSAGAILPLIESFIKAGGKITSDIARLHLVLDKERNQLHSMQYYADAWKTTFHFVRTTFKAVGLTAANAPQRTGENSSDSSIPRKRSAKAATDVANGAQTNGEIPTETNDSRKRSANGQNAGSTAQHQNGQIDSESSNPRKPPNPSYNSIGNKRESNAGARVIEDDRPNVWPTLEQVTAVFRGRGGGAELAKQFFRYYEKRFWKLKTGEALPDWNWIIQVDVFIENEQSGKFKPTAERTERKVNANGASGGKSNANAVDPKEQREQHFKSIFGE
jgi:hypothetical protein